MLVWGWLLLPRVRYLSSDSSFTQLNRSYLPIRERCLGPRAVSVSPLPDAHQNGQVQVASITNSYTTMDIAAEYIEQIKS